MRLLARTALAALLVATVLPGAAAAPTGCDRWTKGPWTTYRPPRFDDVKIDDSGNRYDIAPLLHLLSFGFGGAFAGGRSSRAFVTDSFTIARTVDTGCSWRNTYSLDPRSAPNAVADPALLLPTGNTEYKITAIGAAPYAGAAGPQAGRDTVVAFAQNGDGWLTGIPQNLAGQMAYVAHSSDGGATWRTGVFQAKLEGAPVATPILGDGLLSPYVAVSPADTKTVFVVADTRDPRAVLPPTTEGKVVVGWPALYVSRDAGATWSFAAPETYAHGLAADPADPNTAWVLLADSTAKEDRLTAVDARTGKSRTVFTPPSGIGLTGMDVAGGAGRATHIVLTGTHYNQTTRHSEMSLFVSADAGKHWTRLAPPNGTGGWMQPIGAGRVTERGDVVVLLTASTFNTSLYQFSRWVAARRAWTRVPYGQLPLPPGAARFAPVDLLGADAAHRYLMLYGTVAPTTQNVGLIALYDSRADR